MGRYDFVYVVTFVTLHGLLRCILFYAFVVVGHTYAVAGTRTRFTRFTHGFTVGYVYVTLFDFGYALLLRI